MHSIYTRPPAVAGPEHALPPWSVLYKTELRLCGWLCRGAATNECQIMIDLADIADIVSPHAPLQSLIALAELGLVDELELIGERAKVTFDATKLAAIVDDAARHVTSFDAAQ